MQILIGFTAFPSTSAASTDSENKTMGSGNVDPSTSSLCAKTIFRWMIPSMCCGDTSCQRDGRFVLRAPTVTYTSFFVMDGTLLYMVTGPSTMGRWENQSGRLSSRRSDIDQIPPMKLRVTAKEMRAASGLLNFSLCVLTKELFLWLIVTLSGFCLRSALIHLRPSCVHSPYRECLPHT
jgi:hypothetical protein